MLQLLLAAALAVCVALPQAPAASRTRDIHVSVFDKDGKPVPDLTAADFIVREDGTPREVVKVQPSTAPLTISVLVDDSQAAQPAIQQLREGLTTFFTTLPETAEVALATFGERPTSLVEYTTSREQLNRAAGRIFARPGTGAYMLDAVVEVSKGLQKKDPARPVIVVVTIEGVEFSNLRHEAALRELYKAGAVLHVLAVGTPGSLLEDEMRSRQILIAEGTSATGGRRDQLLTEMALPDKLKQVAEDLKNSKAYQVTYGRPERLVPAEMVEVAVKQPELVVRPARRAAGR